jgi:hypothetical protein
MRNRIVAAIGAGALVIGILVGAAGAVVVRDAMSPERTQTFGSVDQMMNMIGGSRMGGAWADGMADMHRLHHGTGR